jgi:hypothetical protein
MAEENEINEDDLPDGLSVDDGEVVETPETPETSDDDLTGEEDTDQDPTTGDGDGPADGGEPSDDDPVAPLKSEIETLKQKIEELTTETTPTGESTPGPKNPWDDARGQKVAYDDVNHPYHGKTLGEIYDIDPSEAYAINGYLTMQIELGARESANQSATQAKMEEAERDRAIAEQTRRETEEFQSEFSKSNFDLDYSTLTPEQRIEVEKATDRVMEWMIENKKFGITISEAHYLMDRAGQTQRIVEKVVKDASRRSVRNISSKRDTGVDESEANMSKWSPERMDKYLEGLDGDEFSKFTTSASSAVRKAFPDLPWS